MGEDDCDEEDEDQQDDEDDEDDEEDEQQEDKKKKKKKKDSKDKKKEKEKKKKEKKNSMLLHALSEWNTQPGARTKYTLSMPLPQPPLNVTVATQNGTKNAQLHQPVPTSLPTIPDSNHTIPCGSNSQATI